MALLLTLSCNKILMMMMMMMILMAVAINVDDDDYNYDYAVVGGGGFDDAPIKAIQEFINSAALPFYAYSN